MSNLTNVEFILLEIIHEKAETSGYSINNVILERGIREWAGIGTTSIYSGLSKLEKKEFVAGEVDYSKKGKGPLPKKYRLTAEGINILKQEIVHSLSSTRERDRKFDIALAWIMFISRDNAVEALNKRKHFLESETARIKEVFNAQGGFSLPFHVIALFRHTFGMLESEIKFSDFVINGLM